MGLFKPNDRHALSALFSIIIALVASPVLAQDAGQENHPRAAEAFGADELALIESGRREGRAVVEAAQMSTPAMLSASPLILDFGAIEILTTTSQMLSLTNVGAIPVNAEVRTTPPFSTDTPSIQLEPEASIEIAVTFSPEARESFENALSFVAGEEPLLDVPLTGSGIGPVAVIQPSSIDFRTVVIGQSLRRRVRVENDGELFLNGPLTSLAPDSFNLIGDSFSLAAGESATIEIEFRPEIVGMQGGSVQPIGPAEPAIQVTGIGAESIGQVRGQVVDAQSKDPLACAAVAFDAGAGFLSVAVTDANGVFVTEPLPQSAYTAAVYSPGYERASITFDLNQGLVERRIELQPRASGDTVRGVVGDAVSGALLGGVHVRVFQGQTEVDSAFTCANGNYEVQIPDPNSALDFVLEAVGFDGGSMKQLVDPPFDSPVNFVMFPDVVSSAEIGGVVTSSSNGGIISMATVSASAQGLVHSTFSRNDGSYRLSSIAPGEYLLRFSANAHLAEDDILAAAFEGDEPSATSAELVAGIDEVASTEGEGEGEGTGCSASGQQAPRRVPEFLVVIALVAVSLSWRKPVLQRQR